MQLEILTPDKTLYSGIVTSVIFPGTDGTFQILNNHAALVASLKKGAINIKSTSGDEQLEINGGVVEVLNDKIVVLV
jgi:F-type H+-transporting ATPase subunit epsilon